MERKKPVTQRLFMRSRRCEQIEGEKLVIATSSSLVALDGQRGNQVELKLKMTRKQPLTSLILLVNCSRFSGLSHYFIRGIIHQHSK